MSRHNQNWTREETILAIDLYCKILLKSFESEQTDCSTCFNHRQISKRCRIKSGRSCTF